MKIKAVIFDLFGTLVDDFVSSVGEMHQEMAAALAVPYEQFMQLWRQTAEMRIIGAFDSVEANIEYVCDTMKVSPHAEQIEKAVEIRMKYIRRALQPRPDAIHTPSQLKTQGYRIGLISNCSIEIPILWHETDFANIIETPIFSCRARIKKPDTRIYHLACERLGVMAEACLYIADGEDRELTAAAKVGLRPVLIRSPSHKNDDRLHEEAREWQGTTIASLPEVLQLAQG
jgi:putative hydrolase of the HAD superfamily